jgi:hypothetical protein
MGFRRTLVAGIALGAIAMTARAQVAPRHKGFTAGIGVAQGKLRVSCSGCTFPAKEGALVATFKAGWSLSDALILNGDFAIYTKHMEDNVTGAEQNTNYQLMTAALQWYPSRKWEHFFKFGGGFSHSTMALDVSSLGARDIKTTGATTRVGFGTDLRFGRKWSLTPYVDYAMGLKANTSVDGLTVKVSMLLFGATITWH